ncbi:hypothetical protein [Sphingomonas sp. CROZ-RG-20F-R02-07]|nr:hypothetical protein [Sphingomonas sp. CROZ-RG-20F-R02-07]
MTNSSFGRTIATLACTLLFSGMAIIGAVGPATAGPGSASPTTHTVA